ncbi:hypothetical protein [Desulfofundulus salinus]|uniref:hypothetical protein n=1 Tax=Desulfofundulus salinus TaxID=2419843 RepID=UPI001A9ADC9E|nr:hypothetical protein [Desulfofundulus salinum]
MNNLQTTLDIYTHTSPELVKRAATKRTSEGKEKSLPFRKANDGLTTPLFSWWAG